MSWRRVTLEDLVDNFSVRAKDVGGGANLPFYGVSNEDGITKSKYAAEEKADDYKVIEKSCFAYNPYRVNVGSIALMESEENGLISPAYVVFKPKPRSIIPRLLLKFLKSNEGLRQIKLYARGTVRQALRFEDLCKIELSIPDYDEQEIFYEKIENVEREVKALSTELTHQLDIVKQLRQAFLREAMQGKLVPQDERDEPASALLQKIKAEKEKLIKEGKLKKQKELPPIKPEEIPFKIPESWVWCRLGYIAKFLNGYAFQSQWFKQEGIPLLRNINVGIKEIVWDKVARLPKERAKQFEDYLLSEGDIILSLDRPIISGGLKVAQVKRKDIPCLLLQRVLKISGIKISSDYLFSWFNSELFFDKINPGRSIGIPHISHNDVSKVLFPLPPLSEQHRIVTKLEQLMRHCDELEQSIKESQAQNEQLLQQVLREALRPGKEYEIKDALSLAAEG